jgi:D-arabinose 5-phosphate isomerase GutQ
MGDTELGVYLHAYLASRGIPVVAVTVSGEGSSAREASIALETESIEAINSDLDRVMGNTAHAVYVVVDERGTNLDFYSVVLTDKAGTELLTLRVDINNKISRSHQDPRLSPLWLSPPPNVLKWWSETYGN